MAKECASTMFPYCDEHLYGIQSSCHHPIMNPIIVNKESYFQFTMNAIACPLPPPLHFHLPGIADEKRSQEGRMHRECKPKGDGMFANRTPIAKHQPTDGAKRTPARRRKTGEPSVHAPKKMEQLG